MSKGVDKKPKEEKYFYCQLIKNTDINKYSCSSLKKNQKHFISFAVVISNKKTKKNEKILIKHFFEVSTMITKTNNNHLMLSLIFSLYFFSCAYFIFSWCSIKTAFIPKILNFYFMLFQTLKKSIYKESLFIWIKN